MLTVSNVTKKYGKKVAIENINLNLDNGLYGLLAPNGAGKTTLIKMITTLLFPTSGDILWNGVEIQKMGAEYRSLLGYLPQKFGYYRNNTPLQYLDYLAALKGMPLEGLKQRIDEVIAQVGLSESADVKMKKFSGGMLQRVGIAQAILGNPKILILDEPTAGLDPKERVRFRNIISALSKDRIVILSTHIVSDIESIANRVVMIKDRSIYKNDTVTAICSELDGCVFEISLTDSEYCDFEKNHLVLSARQERNGMTVRFYSDGKMDINARECVPNLEDVFLVTYR
jgi:ABC-type multidrug transport system ATPase subunit